MDGTAYTTIAQALRDFGAPTLIIVYLMVALWYAGKAFKEFALVPLSGKIARLLEEATATVVQVRETQQSIDRRLQHIEELMHINTTQIAAAVLQKQEKA